jgi:hypothetical protein
MILLVGDTQFLFPVASSITFCRDGVAGRISNSFVRLVSDQE